MKAGIDTAESKYVGYMDADMQTDVRDFDLLLKYAPEYPLVMGIRARRKGFCVQADAVHVSLPPYDDARRSDRHGLSAENPSYRLCKACSVLYRHAPFLPALIQLQDGGKFYEIPVRQANTILEDSE